MYIQSKRKLREHYHTKMDVIHDTIKFEITLAICTQLAHKQINSEELKVRRHQFVPNNYYKLLECTANKQLHITRRRANVQNQINDPYNPASIIKSK